MALSLFKTLQLLWPLWQGRKNCQRFWQSQPKEGGYRVVALVLSDSAFSLIEPLVDKGLQRGSRSAGTQCRHSQKRRLPINSVYWQSAKDKFTASAP